MSFIAGIDPGVSGGVAFLGYGPPAIGEIDELEKRIVEAYKMPETETDVRELLASRRPDHVYLEALNALPPSMRGGIASFKIGKSYGFLRGVLVGLGIPFTEVGARKWQKAIGVVYPDGVTDTEKKNITKQLAQQWFPQLKIIHATADALLIARYGERQELGKLATR